MRSAISGSVHPSPTRLALLASILARLILYLPLCSRIGTDAHWALLLPQSLGCTLFALAYSHSPFEDPAQAGGSIAMAVASGAYRHPSSSPYSDDFKKLIDGMLVVRVDRRPGIDQVRVVFSRLLLLLLLWSAKSLG